MGSRLQADRAYPGADQEHHQARGWSGHQPHHLGGSAQLHQRDSAGAAGNLKSAAAKDRPALKSLLACDLLFTRGEEGGTVSVASMSQGRMSK